MSMRLTILTISGSGLFKIDSTLADAPLTKGLHTAVRAGFLQFDRLGSYPGRRISLCKRVQIILIRDPALSGVPKLVSELLITAWIATPSLPMHLSIMRKAQPHDCIARNKSLS
jgi:hypothetical protein